MRFEDTGWIYVTQEKVVWCENCTETSGALKCWVFIGRLCDR
jgi:hypothetical protein